MKVWRSAALLLSIVHTTGAAGCGAGKGRASGVQAATGERRGAPGFYDATDPLSRRMTQIAMSLRSIGLRVGGAEGRGFLAARGNATHAVTIPSQTCALIVTLASPGLRDLDATLFSPEGYVLAEDTEPHSHPIVQVCADEHTRRVYFNLAAYDGAGAFLVATFVGSRRRFAGAMKAIASRPTIAAETLSEAEQEARLRDFTAAVGRRGFQLEGRPIRIRLAADQRIRVPLSVRAFRCYTVAAFALGDVRDLNLRVVEEDGRELVTDNSPATHAAVQFCPRQPGDLTVELFGKGGAGQAELASYQGNVGIVGGGSALWLGTRPEDAVSSVPLGSVLAKRIDEARRAGYPEPLSTKTGTLAFGQALSERISLGGGRCTLVLVTSGQGVGRFRLRVVGVKGEFSEERQSTGNTASVRVCAAQATAADVQLVSELGGGQYALSILSRESPQSLMAQLSLHELGLVLDAVDTDLGAGWLPAGFSDDGQAAQGYPVRVVALTSPRFSNRITFSPMIDSCVRVHVLPGGNAAGVIQATLMGRDPPTHRTVDSRATLESCSTRGDGRVSVQLELSSSRTARAIVVGVQRPRRSTPTP